MSKLRSLGRTADLVPLAAAGWQAEAAAMVSNNLTSATGVALTSHAIVNSIAQTSGVTNQSSVDALAVNTAVAAYLAKTGTALNGAGLKIGILSDSFNLGGGEAADIANGDLPPASDIHILQEGTSGSDEGRALAELVHSIAPDAQIYFYTGTTSEAGMATGINTLTSLGMNVIIDDITYTDEPFYQDTGVVTHAVESAIAAGVSYFTSAGNDSNNYYEAAFSPMTFALPGIGTEMTNNVSGGSPYEAVHLGPDPTLDFTMEWTQPFGANQYDIGVGLYSYSASTGYTLIQDFATSTLGGDPILSIYTTLGLLSGTYYLAFYESGSNLVNGKPITPGTFKILAFQDSTATFTGVGSGTGSGASIGHELVPGVNTIAAVNVAQTPFNGVAVPVVEPYSSGGTGETYINAAGVTLATPINDGSPDFAATDGSPTSVFNPFDGTSAAAASAAAVGLLVIEADNALTPAQVSYLLKISAIPANSSVSGGAGLIQASTAVANALTAHTTPIWTGMGSTALWSTAANWSDAAAPTAATAVKIGDGIGILTGAYTVDYNVAAETVTSLKVAGGTITGAAPDLAIIAADALTTGSVTLGSGIIDVAGTLDDTGALTASAAAGVIDIESSGAVSIAGAAAAQDIAFIGSGGRLIFGTTTALTLTQGLVAPITNFQAGDVIDLSGLEESSVASVSVAGSTVELLNGSGQALAVLTVSGAILGLTFIDDSTGGTLLVAGVAANFENLDVAGQTGPQTVTVGAATSGELELTNASISGTTGLTTTTPGVANVSVTVPAGYNQLLVTAPGTENIAGNGSNNFSATFGANSAVTFNSNGGSGTVAAGGSSDFVNVSGTVWTVTGASVGGDTINASASNAAISVFGAGNALNNAVGADSTPSNVVGLAGPVANLYADGTNDLIETYAGSDAVSVYGSANVVVNGGADTVYAMAGNNVVNAFFNLFGGTLDFINNSTTEAFIQGDVPGASGGEVTAFGGAGGGSYIGGSAGNNSLVGGTGKVTLVGSGSSNFLEANGFASSAASENILSADVVSTGGADAYMLASSTTGYNEFHGDAGSDTMVSHGSGAQVFYVGASGQELMTGSTTSGATNTYVFDQDSTGNGSDVITNFKVSRDNIYINLGTTVNHTVTVQSFGALGGGTPGTVIYLSDHTSIQLYGVSSSSLNASIIGTTHI
jgi:hypothetical protein